MSIKINEYVDYVNNVTLYNKYPKKGSTGVYISDLIIKSRSLSATALKLFLIIASDIDDYGQTKRTRVEFSKALEIKYNKSRLSRLFNELVDEKFIVYFGKYITVNPYIVLPKVNNPKIKSVLQEAWYDIVEYN